jgi:hypothetical protein
MSAKGQHITKRKHQSRKGDHRTHLLLNTNMIRKGNKKVPSDPRNRELKAYS